MLPKVRFAAGGRSSAGRAKTREKAAFLAGVLTAVCVGLVLVVLVVDRVGSSVLFAQLYKGFMPGRWRRERIIQLPAELINELLAVEAVIDNSDNPTAAARHDTILVQPDPELGYVLRPGVAISGYVLKANDPLNLDPPVLYLRSDTQLSAAAGRFIAAHQRGHFVCTTNGHALRRTLPAVAAERRLLMVGDSVCFGLGVDDEATMASFLQRRIGPQVRVLNAGVGGFDGLQAGKMAARLASEAAYDRLVYVACENDFGHRAETAPEVLAPFARLRPRFADNVLVLFVPYVEYVMNDVLGHYGFAPELVHGVDELRAELPKLCHTLGLKYLDFTEPIRGHSAAAERFSQASISMWTTATSHLTATSWPRGWWPTHWPPTTASEGDCNHVKTKPRPLGDPFDRPDQPGRDSADQGARVHHALRDRQPRCAEGRCVRGRARLPAKLRQLSGPAGRYPGGRRLYLAAEWYAFRMDRARHWSEANMFCAKSPSRPAPMKFTRSNARPNSRDYG